MSMRAPTSGDSSNATGMNSFNVLMTRYVRLYTISIRNGNGLRWELYGCIYNGKAPEVYTDAYECISSWRCTCTSV